MSFIWKTLGLVRRFATSLMFVVMFAVFVASHTITSLAAITNTVIETVSGVTTVAANALTGRPQLKQEMKATHRKATAKIRSLEAELEATERMNRELKANRKTSTAKINSLEADLKKAKAADQVTFRGRKMTARQASLEVTKTLGLRTKRVATANLTSVAGESIPFYGIAVIIAATSYELVAACNSMKDVHDLAVAMDPNAAFGEDRDQVCGLKAPTKEEAWAAVKESPSAAWRKSVAAYEGTSSALTSLEMPNFSGGWTRMINWFSSWVE